MEEERQKLQLSAHQAEARNNKLDRTFTTPQNRKDVVQCWGYNFLEESPCYWKLEEIPSQMYDKT